MSIILPPGPPGPPPEPPFTLRNANGASNIQRGTRRADAGDWIRLKRLNGARQYASDYSTNKDITNPSPVPCCVSTSNNRMDRAEFGTSKFRRPASEYTNYKAWGVADLVTEQNSTSGGKILTAVRLCNCAQSDPNKHNPTCVACKYDKIEVRNKTLSFYVQGQFNYTFGIYTPNGDYSAIIQYLATLYNVPVDQVRISITSGSINITYQILAFTTETPSNPAIQSAIANIIQRYPAATGLSFVGSDISGYCVITQNGVTSSPITLFTPRFTVTTLVRNTFYLGYITNLGIDPFDNIYFWNIETGNVCMVGPSGAVRLLSDLGMPTVMGIGGAPIANIVLLAVSRNSFAMYAIKYGGNVIYSFFADGTYSVAYGDVNTNGNTNGPMNASTFQSLSGIVTDSIGNIYVSQSDEYLIRKINIQTATVETYVDVSATGQQPTSLAIDSNNNLYFVSGNMIYKVDVNKTVTIFVGQTTAGYINGIGLSSRFNNIGGITIDSNDNIYAADSGNNLIRKITPTRVVTTFSGDGTSGYINGNSLLTTKFNHPVALVFDSYGSALIADEGNRAIRKITFNPSIPTISYGSMSIFATIPDEVGSISIDTNNKIYVLSPFYAKVYKYNENGTIADRVYNWNPATTMPTSMTTDSFNNMYVVNGYNNTLNKVTSFDLVPTIIPTPFFRSIFTVSADGTGNIYLLGRDSFTTSTYTINKISSTGIVTTAVTNLDSRSFAVDSFGNIYARRSSGVYKFMTNGTSQKLFETPEELSIAVNYAGTYIYIIERYRTNFTSKLTILNQSGNITKTINLEFFSVSIDVSRDDVIYVSDYFNYKIVKITY